MTHGNELNQAIRDVLDAEWNEIEEFDEIVDNAVGVLMAAIYVDDTFSEYSDEEIQSDVYDEICLGFHEAVEEESRRYSRR